MKNIFTLFLLFLAVSSYGQKQPFSNIKKGVDARDLYLSEFGQRRIGGTVQWIPGTSRTVKLTASTYYRWDNVNKVDVETNWAALNPMVFDLYDQNGLISSAQTIVPDQYDNSGVVTTLVNNAETAHRIFQNPLTGEVALLLSQTIHSTGAETIKKFSTDLVMIPPALDSYQYIGALIVSQGEDNFELDNDTGFIPADSMGSVPR